MNHHSSSYLSSSYRIGFGRIGKSLVAVALAAVAAGSVAIAEAKQSPKVAADASASVVRLEPVTVTISGARFDAIRAEETGTAVARR